TAVAILAAAWITVHGQQLPGAPTRTPIGQPSQPPASPRGVIVGQVIDAASGRGVARAAVHMSGHGVDLLQVADDRGRFYFLDIPEGTVEISATKTGFYDGAYGKRRAGGSGVPLTMTPGRWVTDLRIEVFRGAAISGVVSDESGEPV